MIYITKQAEPDSLKAHRNTPGADFDSLDKAELRNSLLEEQGCLCAYCMRKILKNVKIEHYCARNTQNEMQYINLLAVCTGNELLVGTKGKVESARFTCDTQKRNQKIKINPQSKLDMETIYYDNQGKLYSRNSDFMRDLDETLNLNDPCGFLIRNRRKVLEAVMNQLKGLKPGQDALPLLRKIEKYGSQKNADGEYPEYVGIIRWYVARQIRKRT